jgi:hypothetical protein
MHRSVTFRIALAGLVAGLASVYGCGGGKPLAGGSAGNGVAGNGGMAGSTTAGSAGAAGQSTAGAIGNDGGTGGMASSNDDGAADATETRGANDITKVLPTVGCGTDPGQAPGMTIAYTIATSGSKTSNCADTKCGPWTGTRQYFITLPTGYDKNKALPLVFQGPGCGATGQDVPPLDSDNDVTKPNVDNTVIRIGLTPLNSIGDATSLGQGCFDFADGDNSVDWVFYEDLYDRLAQQLCFDRNRVFVSGGPDSGAWFANELGCRFAGDEARPIRGMLAHIGGLPNQVEAPGALTCTTKPMAGIWVEQALDTEAPFAETEVAVARAMKVNGCTIGTNFNDAMFEDFPIGGDNLDTTCRKIAGCPDLTPLVVCLVTATPRVGDDSVVNSGFSTFIKLFGNPPLLTQ